MLRICLDLSFLLSYLSGDSVAVEKVKHEYKEVFYITSLTLCDISLILKDHSIAEALKESFEIMPFDERAALITREIFDELEMNGFKPNKRAVMEAAVCIVNKAYLLTKNKSIYKGISKLKVIV